jgi:uncharacterized protein (DUF1501 family)
MDRRNFLKTSLGALYMMASPSMAFPGTVATDKRLLIVVLRGGMDGLSTLPPLGDKNLSKIRKDILIRGANNLDGFFGIHPQLKFLESEYKQGRAAFVHATSFPYTGRSHFDGQNIMETGSSNAYEVSTGWVGRAMNAAGYGSLSISLPIPLILRGNNQNSNFYPSMFSTVSNFIYEDIEKLWETDDGLKNMVKPLKTRTTGSGRGDTNALVSYAADEMNKVDGPRVGLLEIGGNNAFDTHALQGNEAGKHSELMEELDIVLKNFKKKMGPLYDNTVVVTVTEFGRTASENGSQGTDHGYASAILLAGGLVKGNQVVSDWPGLSSKNLYEGRDLTMTIDARDVYSELVSKVFDLNSEIVSRDVFLGYKPKKYHGLLREV